MTSIIHGCFEADLGRLDEVLSFLDASIGSASINGERKMDLLVAAEEAFINIFKHGYERGGRVEVTVTVAPGSISLTLVDEGRPFDPRSVPPPDLDAEPEDRKVGGLGVHLIRSLVDDIQYSHEEGKNMLTLIMSTGDRSVPNDPDEER